MSDPNRGIGSFTSNKEKNTPIVRTNHLLVIGIDAYDNEIPILHNAVRDAKAFEKVMLDNYQFDPTRVTRLFNKEATKKNILKAFDQHLEQLTNLDNLVIYFSGHGELHEITDRGYWIPADAKKGDRSTFLSNSEVVDFFKYCKAHHIFSIVDSCFSGSLFEAQKGDFMEEKLVNIPSRWLLTAGMKEPVSDGALGKNSPFATSLLIHLENNIEDSLWCSDLCNRVLKGVSFNSQKQTPRGEPLQNVGHQGGQFVFYKKGVIPQIKNQPQPIKEPIVNPTRNIESTPAPPSPEPTPPKNLQELKLQLKQNIFDLAEVFDQLNKSLNTESRRYNDFILIFAQFNSLSKKINQNTISEADATLTTNKLRNSTLAFIDKLKEPDLNITFSSSSSSTHEDIEIKGLENQLVLLTKKLNLIEKKLILEDDPTRILRYELDKEETETKILEVKNKLRNSDRVN